MPERRLAQRFSRRVKVKFWRRGAAREVFSGYTTNLSERGTFIETAHPIGTGARLQVEFASEQGGFLIEARVARSIRTPFELRQVRASGMGLQFVPVRDLLAEIVPLGGEVSFASSPSQEQEIATPSQSHGPPRGTATAPLSVGAASANVSPQTTSGPGDPDPDADPDPTPLRNPARFHPAASPYQKQNAVEPGVEASGDPSEEGASLGGEPSGVPLGDDAPFTTTQPGVEKTFTIRFRDVERLRQVWKNELQYGGLFLPTPRPLQIDATVELLFFLPQHGEGLRLDGRVVLVNQPGSKDSPNLLVGMGIRLSHPEPLFREIRALLQRSSS